MIRYLTFDGPDNTLFLLESGMLRIITEAAEEAVLPLRDLVELLVYLSLQPVQAHRRLHNRQVALLALALREHS